MQEYGNYIQYKCLRILVEINFHKERVYQVDQLYNAVIILFV